MRRILISLIASLVWIPFALAVDGPDGTTLNGLASFTELKRPMYIGAYYSDVPSGDAEEILQTTGRRRMDMRVNARRWTPRRFSSQWTQALLINSTPEQLSRFDDAFVQFNNLPRETFVYGDQIVVDGYPDGKTVVRVNGVEMLNVKRSGFFELLMSKWIGARPPSSEFKASILSQNPDLDLYAEFENIVPSEERKATIAGWMGGTAAVAKAKPKPKPKPKP
ncbi:MAG: chalcone isomerase family protein, partial [Pseudomonadales bacterium]